MKKNLAKKITLSILAGAVLMSNSIAWAAKNPELRGWEKSSNMWNVSQYKWLGSTGGAPNGEVNGAGHTFDGSFYGVYETGKDAEGGKVTINGGTFSGRSLIYGGYVGGGNNKAKGNVVIINNGTFNANIYGGFGASGNIDVVSNTVEINNGTFDEMSIYGGHIHDRYATGNANENKVIISGGKFNNSNIYGGYAEGGGNSNDLGANGNTVEINGVGTSTFGSIYGGWTKDGNANDNIVTLYDGTFAGMVAGGYLVNPNEPNASGNKVTISGDANVKEAELYGGRWRDPNGGYHATYGAETGGANNILTIGTDKYSWRHLHNTSSNNNIKSIQGFDEIIFEHVKWDTVNPAVKVSALQLDSIYGTQITVNNLYVAGDDETFKANAKMTLIDSGDTTGDFDAANSKVAKIHRGVARIYDADIVYEGNTDPNSATNIVSRDYNEDGDVDDIIIQLGGTELTPGSPEFEKLYGTATYPESGPKPVSKRNDQVLVVGESRAVATAFTDQGSELVELGINALARDEDKDYKVFAALYGNASEYATGSHVNVNGWSGIVGIGKTNADGLTVGAFFENGAGNYSTHNVTDFGYLRGDGEACYNGGGFLVRKDNANGVYTEAAIRAGNLQNELRDAVIGSTGAIGYDIDTFYYGAQIGIGKIIPRGNDGDSVDVYGKFIYTHHDSEDFTIDGDDFHFDSVDSERLRLGFRINEVKTNKLAMYYGAVWEYEFGGDADNTVVGYDLSTPSLGGSTVIGEIGAHYKASEKWSVDLNGRAYVGQREGFSGSVQANYAF